MRGVQSPSRRCKGVCTVCLIEDGGLVLASLSVQSRIDGEMAMEMRWRRKLMQVLSEWNIKEGGISKAIRRE